MLRLLGKLPREVHLAVSAGVDSQAIYSFLSRNHKVIPVFFHHESPDCFIAEKFLDKYFGNKLIKGRIKDPNKPKGKSLEEYWREERYAFLKKFSRFLITGHHLDDQVETYIFSSMHGSPKLMKYFNGLVYRPFLLNRKKQLVDWCDKNKVPYLYDESNSDISKRRNYIRNVMMPHILNINPGIYKTIAKKTLAMSM